MTLRRIKERLEFFDFKSLVLTLTLLGFGTALFIFLWTLRDESRDDYLASLDKQGTPHILKVDSVTRMNNGKYSGTKFYVDGYKVTYKFQIIGDELIGEDFIHIAPSNRGLLDAILNKDLHWEILVKYDSKDPKRNMLTLRL